MKHYQSILVGHDGSTCSEHAVLEGLRISRWTDSPLQVLHIIERHDLGEIGRVRGYGAQAIIDGQTARDRYRIGELAKGVEGDSSWDLRVESGHPADLLLEEIEARDCNLVILGAQGQTEDPTGRLGSTARQLLRTTPVDLMMIREAQSEPFKQVIAVLGDGDSDDRDAFERALDIALHEGSILSVVSCYPTGWIEKFDDSDEAEPQKAELHETGLAARLEKLEDLIAEAISGHSLTADQQPDLRVLSSHNPTQAILDALAEEEGRLAVVSAHLRHDRPDAEQIAGLTPCSVLMIGEAPGIPSPS